jgi:hypothetical protein
MNQTPSVRRHIQIVEGLPQFQSPPGPLEPISRRALRPMWDEDLELMIPMVICRPDDDDRTEAEYTIQVVFVSAAGNQRP